MLGASCFGQHLPGAPVIAIGYPWSRDDVPGELEASRGD